jgi:hypothetical protein
MIENFLNELLKWDTVSDYKSDRKWFENLTQNTRVRYKAKKWNFSVIYAPHKPFKTVFPTQSTRE